MLEADVAKVFKDSAAVNKALRKLLEAVPVMAAQRMPPTAADPCSQHWSGPWRSAGGEQRTFGRSWPPVDTHPVPRLPGRRWC